MFDRIFISIVGVLFIVTAIAGLFFPVHLTSMVDVSLDYVSAHSEIRSNYGGMHLMLGSFILWSGITRKYTESALLLTLLFTGGYVLGRSVSFVVDGDPNLFVYLVTFGEAFGAVTAFYLLRRNIMQKNNDA